MKILTVIGARPQFVKASAVSAAARDYQRLEEVLVHTGQHFDRNMSDIFFRELVIPEPRYNLQVNSLSHGAMTGQMLERLEAVLLEERPDWVLVYGDTNSTLAGALAAKKLHLRVAHVEAGLRSFNMRMPEEINRVVADRLSDLLFCPTDAAVENLRAEGFGRMPCQIVKSGDVMLDVALNVARRLDAGELSVGGDLRETAARRPFVLATVHRAENTDDPVRLGGIVAALNAINEETPVVLPLHPRTRKRVEAAGLRCGFTPLDPVGYAEMIYLLRRSALVMTDSGGLQKEAYFMRVPCVTLRDETEWVETVALGCNFIAGAEAGNILAAYARVRDSVFDFSQQPYGDGAAARVILDELLGQ